MIYTTFYQKKKMIYTTFETSHLKASKAMLKLENLEDTS